MKISCRDLVPEEGLLDPGGLPRGPETEEGVVLHGALPQVLAATLSAQPTVHNHLSGLSFLCYGNQWFRGGLHH